MEATPRNGTLIVLPSNWLLELHIGVFLPGGFQGL